MSNSGLKAFSTLQGGLSFGRSFFVTGNEQFSWFFYGFAFLMVAATLFLKWSRDRAKEREEDRKLRTQEMKTERELRLHEAEAARARERTLLENLLNRNDGAARVEPHGGFIYLNMPENQKAIFHDVLKGFEDYARLKGYDIRFSVDGSEPNRIAFKFTILNTGITVSPQQVKRDLQEYIEKVQRGDPLDDLPIILPEPEHHMVLLTMRNRINFLHHTVVAQGNALKLYEDIIRSVPGRAISQAPVFYLQGSGNMNTNSYSAINSAQIAQGENNKLLRNSSTFTLNMGNTHTEREERVSAILHLTIKLIEEQKKDPTLEKPLRTAREMLDKAETEIKDEPVPDESRVFRYLSTAKECLKALALGREAQEAAKKLWELFELPS